MIYSFQDKVKTSSNTLGLLAFRIFTGLFLGLTFALIGDQVINYGWFSFTLVIVAVCGALLKITRGWSWLQVFIFNLICVLIGLLLRMYILIAPG